MIKYKGGYYIKADVGKMCYSSVPKIKFSGAVYVLARNITNVEQIEDFLSEFSSENPKIQKWIESNLRKYIINKQKTSPYRSKPEDDAPDWLKKAYESGQELLEVVLDTKLKDQIEHAIDYLEYANYDDYSRVAPEDAFKKSVEWIQKEEKKEGKDVEGKDFEKIEDLSDGFSMVRLMSDEAIMREGQIMQNCLKGGGYCEDAQKGKLFILSLRDGNDNSHATFEVSSSGNIVQMKGKQNGKIADKYIPYVHEFLRKQGAM